MFSSFYNFFFFIYVILLGLSFLPTFILRFPIPSSFPFCFLFNRALNMLLFKIIYFIYRYILILLFYLHWDWFPAACFIFLLFQFLPWRLLNIRQLFLLFDDVLRVRFLTVNNISLFYWFSQSIFLPNVHKLLFFVIFFFI